MGRHSEKLEHYLKRQITPENTDYDKTLKQTHKNIEKFTDYARDELKINNTRQIAGREIATVQAYSDHLQKRGYSPATIHTYLAAPCKALNIPMNEINKPIRYASAITKGRTNYKNEQGQREQTLDKYERFCNFQRITGIRREELTNLKKTDFKEENGCFYIVVVNGKGGKYQEQKIERPEDIAYIKQVINESKNDYIFSKEECNNKINLHKMRAENAYKMYEYYKKRIETEKGYAEKLKRELLERWDKFHDFDIHGREKFIKEMRNTPYITRASVREVAEANGKPVEYNRLAVMAVSVLQLSHWRANVTISNYLIN